MAKWGEGDPRWIVEERPDSKNVNNWHWTERNCTVWSEKYLKNKLKGLEVIQGDITVKTTEVTSVEGEATVNNRKGKVFYLYDINATVKWEGSAAEGAVTANGRINIKEIIQDDPVDGYQYEIICNDENPDRRRIKDVVSKKLIEEIKKVLKQFPKDLFEENAGGVVLPTKQSSEVQPIPKVGSSSSINKSSSDSLSSKKSVGPTKTIQMKIEFLASANDVFSALTEQGRVQIWTQGQAEISAQPGSKFKLYGGNITGEIISSEQGKKIEKKWRLGTFPEGHFSKVVIEFNQGSSSTELSLTQTGVPEDLFESISENWNRFYWDRIKAIFGWGVLSR